MSRHTSHALPRLGRRPIRPAAKPAGHCNTDRCGNQSALKSAFFQPLLVPDPFVGERKATYNFPLAG